MQSYSTPRDELTVSPPDLPGKTGPGPIEAYDTTTADIDLDGEYETTDLQTTVSQQPAIAANSNRLLGFGQTCSCRR